MPGFDRTGPQGAGPMTGGRRGICASRISQQHDSPFVYGVGRGGRPRGGGRGRAYGGGRGGQTFFAERMPIEADQPIAVEAEPDSIFSGISSVLDKLNDLVTAATTLYDRIESQRKPTKDGEE